MLAARASPSICPSCRLQLLVARCPVQRRIAVGVRHVSALAASDRAVRRGVSQHSALPQRRHAHATHARREQHTADTGTTQSGDELVVPAAMLEAAARRARNRFGDSLPEGFLTEKELLVYERLFGPPVGVVPEGWAEEEAVNERDTILLREAEDGVLEEVDYAVIRDGQEMHAADLAAEIQAEMDTANRVYEDVIKAEGINEPEPPPLEEEQPTDDIDDEHWPGDDYIRTHPYTLTGRFATSPSTLQFPRSTFTQPISALLAGIPTKHLITASQNALGGPGLPYSPSTPRISRTMPQKPLGLLAGQPHLSKMEADVFLAAVMPQTYASVMTVLVELRRRLGAEWLRGLLEKEGGPLVLDAGAGGASALAWRDVLRAEWVGMHPSTGTEPAPPAPLGRATVVTTSATLRHRAAHLLENTSFIPRLPDAVQADHADGANPRKTYDVVIAAHALWIVREEYQRRKVVDALWSLVNPDGGVLVVLEKGVPRGFEVVAGARDILRKKMDPNAARSVQWEGEEERPDRGMIVAPCTNAAQCPLYPVPGISLGRKDWCAFSQRYARPGFLQKVLGAKSRNFDDVEFSYVAVRRGRELGDEGVVQGEGATERAFEGYGVRVGREGEEGEGEAAGNEAEAEVTEPASSVADADAAPHPLTLPRAIWPPLKRRGHILLDLCTPSGTLERWLVSRRCGKQAFRDARKARWGDLWGVRHVARG
ncbi:hypothetical protein EJ06DRAFT_550891 [Trichodelitschia bisporula]|uniref:Rsm22-domain-containing protein n=1 Tax=Trichodelitschia bisporula TaxID=703511 RepID=A0A6G1HN47_9PEZI|nr:hypothetical protein EJ06DRAFT_550891 [Trichodelitschia bisporula]